MTASEQQLVAVSTRIALSHSTIPEKVASRCSYEQPFITLYLHTHRHTHTRTHTHTCMHSQTYCCLVTKLCPTLCDSMNHSLPGASLSVGFSRQEHWSGQPFLSSRDPPEPGSKPGSPARAGVLSTTEPLGDSSCVCIFYFQKLFHTNQRIIIISMD